MQGQRIGYVRVSSFDQNPERQLEGVQVARVFTDKASGKDTQRPELERLLAFVREGDTVVVHSMDRLARNLDDLRRIVQGLTQRGVRMEFVKEGLKFTGEDSPMANLMLSVMGAFAEFEGTVAKLAMRQPFVLFKGLTFQKLCLPGAFRPGDHHNKMLRPGLCVVHASPQYL
ncbi:recombinase family protein [Enterobacter hormaechei]|uniref:recombinase family protein n=1 Tax=Enterobacter hormaechei TaxID=158836 RepID=UPI003F49F44D